MRTAQFSFAVDLYLPCKLETFHQYSTEHRTPIVRSPQTSGWWIHDIVIHNSECSFTNVAELPNLCYKARQVPHLQLTLCHCQQFCTQFCIHTACSFKLCCWHSTTSTADWSRLTRAEHHSKNSWMHHHPPSYAMPSTSKRLNGLGAASYRAHHWKTLVGA